MITHRLSTIATADRIYVLKDGSCIENGTHEELMMQHGMYASMYTKTAGIGTGFMEVVKMKKEHNVY